MSDYCTVYITTETEKEANDIAAALVDENLIACANVFPAVTSHFRWQGRVENETEAAAFFKTRRALVDTIVARVKDLHSYDCPCVTVWPIEGGNPEYLAWVAEETGGAT